jgi:hypothetical protein
MGRLRHSGQNLGREHYRRLAREMLALGAHRCAMVPVSPHNDRVPGSLNRAERRAEIRGKTGQKVSTKMTGATALQRSMAKAVVRPPPMTWIAKAMGEILRRKA